MTKFTFVFAASLLTFTAAPGCLAQLNSNSPSVTLNAVLSEVISISASPSTVNFALVPGGTVTGSAPVVITTSWVLAQGRANVVLDGYFTTPAAALTGGSPAVNIPSSDVYGLMSSGTPTSYTSFTQSGVVGTASGGLALFTQALTSANRNSNRSDNLLLQINLSTLPQLPAATYTGTLILQAQAL